MPVLSCPSRAVAATRSASSAAPAVQLWPHYAVLVAVSFLVSLLYVHEPGFGDELTYWSLSFDLHDLGPAGWSVGSFHDLRWPVWGPSWLWQSLFGPGLSSFYAGPFLYLAAGAALAFTFGRVVVRSLAAAWLCAAAYLMAPLLDLVIYRPIPDLSENVWGGCALLGWWMMMNAASPRRAWLAGIASGLAIGIAYSNRVTGLFIAPVLVLTTVLFFPRRWRWLLLPALVSGLVFLTECAVYQFVCGDWLHSLHANLGGSAAKDVEVTPLWWLPFRYVFLLFHGNRLAPVYTLLTGVGTWAGWRQYGVRGRVVVVWFYALFLEYSCTVQSLHPVLPLIGSTARYLASVALPMSILSALGAEHLWSLFRGKLPWLEARILERRVRVGACCVLLLVLYSPRPFFSLGMLSELRHYMANLPAGTKIFTHHFMRDVAFLADAPAARKFTWTAPRAILVQTPELEQAAAACDEFWCLRKQAWLVERKKLEHNSALSQPVLASYIAEPERDWQLHEVLTKGDAMDVMLFARRPAGTPPPHVLTTGSPEFGGLLPQLPAEWNAGGPSRWVRFKWIIPLALRGRLLSIQTEGSSATVEPLNAQFDFMAKSHHAQEVVFKPIFYRSGGRDFFALKIPRNADHCEVQLKFNKGASHVRLTDFRALYDDAP